MRQLHRARRVGATAVACAVVLRLFAAKVPEKLYFRWKEIRNQNSITEEKTGHYVRFSSSSEGFLPDFVESPPPSLPEPEEISLPVFSGEEAVKLYYAATVEPDIPALLAKPLQWDLTGDAPKVLILHTHATESYSRRGENYKETSPWRTLEEDYNMLAIGDLVAKLLEEQGITVVQDRNLHDYPSYSGSYIRSRKSLKELLEKYPDVQLVLDLHRDASGEEAGQMRTRAEVNGEISAQLMVVIGTNHGQYEENLSLGLKLHAQLESQAPGIMRPLQLRPQRFNQDLSNGALLIEVGAAGNSHGEARIAAKELAKAIIALAKGTLQE